MPACLAWVGCERRRTITAANASKLNDGAAALVLMSRSRAEAMGASPLASVLGAADGAQVCQAFPSFAAHVD
jgi:acetyl-CoA C-acetyltransferase